MQVPDTLSISILNEDIFSYPCCRKINYPDLPMGECFHFIEQLDIATSREFLILTLWG